MNYTPPFEINEEILDLVIKITEKINYVRSVDSLSKMPRLTKINRIRSIHSSLVIENNCISLDDTFLILDGKKIIGPLDEIKAIQNAYLAYQEAEYIDPYNIKNLLKIHKIMMNELTSDNGSFRTQNEGVFDNFNNVIHIASPPQLINMHMNNLFSWLKNSSVHYLIKSCIFHYELEYIHPFSDGNGRMGRLWQTLILSKWNKVFLYLPIETIILEYKNDYYEAIRSSNLDGKSNNFIIFMLNIILKTLDRFNINNQIININKYVNRLLEVLGDLRLSSIEIMNKLNLKSRDSFYNNYLKPALELGLIELEYPDKPRSKNQRYYKK